MIALSPQRAFILFDPESKIIRGLFDLTISFRPKAHKIIVSQKKCGNCNLSESEVSPNTFQSNKNSPRSCVSVLLITPDWNRKLAIFRFKNKS